MQVSKTAAWVVRKIISSRGLIIGTQNLQGDLMHRLEQLQEAEGKFSIKKLYKKLRPPYQKVPWKQMLLQPLLHPRYMFNLWLAVQGRLAIVDRLLKFGINVPRTHVFCGLAEEVFEHLFFDCLIVKGVWSRLLIWLSHPRAIANWSSEVTWINRGAKKKAGHWVVVNCVFDMMVYHIWTGRNKLSW
ncbi:uncharacterized protein LOC132601269 [Lycium barbarum]|uniref:uncharacterized protein LOC132601269 n=1 Tax=Lycium barbarum TaxID=112863 RepID=UPI00293EDC95|nr:uncharacterized protein LOC132601269 [Lycium barbarum]